jgi:hypothetical protein
MGEHLDQIPAQIQSHIRQITKTSGLPDTEDSVEMIAQGWLEKKGLFEKQVAGMSLEQIDILEKTDQRGCLAMTYSGSLLNIGPMRENGRTVQYVSIGLRQDVPETATKEGSERPFPSPRVPFRALPPSSPSRSRARTWIWRSRSARFPRPPRS